MISVNYFIIFQKLKAMLSTLFFQVLIVKSNKLKINKQKLTGCVKNKNRHMKHHLKINDNGQQNKTKWQEGILFIDWVLGNKARLITTISVMFYLILN